MRSVDRILLRIAVVGALVGALGLAGCGRKGGLDPPPGAANGGQEPGAAAEPAGGISPDGRATAPRAGPKRPTPIDFLID